MASKVPANWKLKTIIKKVPAPQKGTNPPKKAIVYLLWGWAAQPQLNRHHLDILHRDEGVFGKHGLYLLQTRQNHLGPSHHFHHHRQVFAHFQDTRVMDLGRSAKTFQTPEHRGPGD